MVREVVEKAVLTGWRGHLSCALLKCAGQPFLGTPHSGPWLLAVGDEQRAKVSEPIITYTLAPITETLQEPDSGELPTPPAAPPLLPPSNFQTQKSLYFPLREKSERINSQIPLAPTPFLPTLKQYI